MTRLTVPGRARQSCVDETHEMGGCSPTCSKARAKVKETQPGYERQLVRCDGEAAMVSHVRLSTPATMALFSVKGLPWGRKRRDATTRVNLPRTPFAGRSSLANKASSRRRWMARRSGSATGVHHKFVEIRKYGQTPGCHWCHAIAPENP